MIVTMISADEIPVCDEKSHSPALNSVGGLALCRTQDGSDFNRRSDDDLITRIHREMLEVSLDKSSLAASHSNRSITQEVAPELGEKFMFNQLLRCDKSNTSLAPHLYTSYRGEIRQKNQQYKLLREADLNAMMDPMDLPLYHKTFGSCNKGSIGVQRQPKQRNGDEKKVIELTSSSIFVKSASNQTDAPSSRSTKKHAPTRITQHQTTATRGTQCSLNELLLPKHKPEKKTPGGISNKKQLGSSRLTSNDEVVRREDQNIQCTLIDPGYGSSNSTKVILEEHAMCTLQCDNNSTSIGSDAEKLQNRTPLNLDPPPLPHEVNDGIVKEGSTEKEMYKVLLVSSTAHDKGRPSKRDTAKANEIKDEYVVRPCTSCVRNDEKNLERHHSENGDSSHETFALEKQPVAKDTEESSKINPKTSDFMRALQYDLCIKNGPVLTHVRNSINTSLCHMREDLIAESLSPYSNAVKNLSEHAKSPESLHSNSITVNEREPTSPNIPSSNCKSMHDVDYVYNSIALSDACVKLFTPIKYECLESKIDIATAPPLKLHCTHNSVDVDQTDVGSGSSNDRICNTETERHAIQSMKTEVATNTIENAPDRISYDKKLNDLHKELQDIRILLEKTTPVKSRSSNHKQTISSYDFELDSPNSRCRSLLRNSTTKSAECRGTIGVSYIEKNNPIDFENTVPIRAPSTILSKQTKEHCTVADISPNSSFACDDDTISYIREETKF